MSSTTNSVLVTSSDPNGIQILVTAVDNDAKESIGEEYYHHFDACEFGAVVLVYYCIVWYICHFSCTVALSSIISRAYPLLLFVCSFCP